MIDYKRELNNYEFKQVIKACRDKVEGISNASWEDIVNKYNLNCSAETLRKAFTGCMGGYSIYRFLTEESQINGLNEIREELGELELTKREIKRKNSKLNKLSNKLSQSVEIAEDLKHYLQKDIQNIKKLPFERLPTNGGYKLLVCISDWHIGYIIKNYKGNNYNYEIAKKRLSKYLSEIKTTCLRYNITDVTVCQLGDITENAYMRETQQAFECEFNMSEQVSKAIKLLYEFITSISEFANIDLISLGGNHSRISNKANNIEGDNFNIIIVEQLKMLVNAADNKRIKILDIDYVSDSHKFRINGLTIKCFHGDKSPKENKKLFDTETSLEGEKIDLIIRGHFHNFSIESQNNNGVVITCGCLFGYNIYSNNTVRSNSNASQCMVVIGNNEIESIKNVNLQFN